MASLNVSMPKDLRDYVNRRTAEGGFGTPTEYVRHLIRKDRDDQAERDLEQLLLQGLKSGPRKRGVKALFQELHRRVDELERQDGARDKRKTARPKTAGRRRLGRTG